MSKKQMEYNELPLENLLMIAAENTTNEDPLKYMDLMYKTINPTAMQLAIKDAKAVLQKEGKRNGKQFDVFLTLGSDGVHRELYTGAIGTLLWLNDYIDIAKEKKGIEAADIETCKRVLRAIDLPTIGDANTASSGCKHYAYFLASLFRWFTSGSPASQNGKIRSNMEVSRFLSAMALQSFPSLPFTSYYVGSAKYDDQMKLTEQIARSFNFNTYMSDISKELNDPKFVVIPENTPLVGIAGHPLANLVLGQLKNDNVEWLGMFVQNEEFAKLCLEAGLSSKDVVGYIYSTSPEAHEELFRKGNPIAKFIETQHLGKQVFELRHKIYGIEKIDENEIDALLK